MEKEKYFVIAQAGNGMKWDVVSQLTENYAEGEGQ